MIDLEKTTQKVCKIARQTGDYLKKERAGFSLDKVEQKNNHDYVSYVDKTSEEILVKALRALLPETGFVTEEGSATYRGETYYWVIDPLDGTTNYIHDNAPYAVSIGLRNKEEVLIGVVYEVCRNECFYAWKNGGAFLDGKRICVTENDTNNALLCLDLPYKHEAYGKTARHLLTHFYGRAAGIRMNGSAAVSLCYIASGRFDGWLEMYLGTWDFTAGALIVTEAGGTVTDFAGTENYLDGNNIVASNGLIHKELLETVQKELPG